MSRLWVGAWVVVSLALTARADAFAITSTCWE